MTRIPDLTRRTAWGLALLGMLIPTSGRTDADHLVKSGTQVTK